jgi:CRP-like cAMP-binding protein
MDVQAGQTLYRRGLHDQELYVVLSGALELWHGGRDPVRCRPGDPLGVVAMLGPRGRRVATAVASEPSSLLVLPRSALRRLSQHHPAVGATLTLNLARWLAASVDELLDERQAPCATASITSTISPPPSGDGCSRPHPSSPPGRPVPATGGCLPSTM